MIERACELVSLASEHDDQASPCGGVAVAKLGDWWCCARCLEAEEQPAVPVAA